MSLAGRATDTEQEKGRVDKTRVRRYWAGKAPEWAQEQDEEPAARERVRTEVAAPVIVRKADDPRLRRLQQAAALDVEDARENHREIRAAEIVRRRRHESEDEADEQQDRDQYARARARSAEPGTEEPSEQPSSEAEDDVHEHRRIVASARGEPQEEEEEDEEEVLKRRQAVRERLLQQQRQAEAQAQQQEEEEEEEEESSSEYETDSEDEYTGGRRLLKPVFVPKESRETIAEREALEKEEEEAAARAAARLEARKDETRQLVAERVALEESMAKATVDEPKDVDDIDTDDEADPVGAYESWKGRELGRIRRDRAAKERVEKEAEERERLRNMTEEERREWERANPKDAGAGKSKSKWRYLQKYWHKGAYFQEGADDEFGTTERDSIFTRDYSAPTGEDKFNKEILPKVMQVKNFGRSGRTKWTHLLSEDTTNFEDPLIKALADKRSAAVFSNGIGGYKRTMVESKQGEEFAKPKKFKT